jgi:hypothetical protein
MAIFAVGVISFVLSSMSGKSKPPSSSSVATKTASFVERSSTPPIYVDPRLLTSDPSAYEGQHLKLHGRALNAEQSSGYTWINLMADTSNNGTESVVIHLFPPDKTFLTDEYYCFYGFGNGDTPVIMQLTGHETRRPLVFAYKITHSTPTGRC